MIPIGVINSFLYLLFTLLDISILAEVILSYIPSVRESNFYKILVSFNNPILSPFRTLQEKLFGSMMIDFAPLLAIVILNFISGILI
ncbi:YggT family protein [uncultured Clostridium sp.]|uniref:YggT family protein n=1 Tax=uncultured Clostridium sp. TaxID=59620 RepID=UPI00272C125D|nr:YggT family protein [uncultured Clostridium sp.]